MHTLVLNSHKCNGTCPGESGSDCDENRRGSNGPSTSTEPELESSVKELEKKGGKSSNWSPPQWKEHLARIRKMREGRSAPVDSMGAAELPEATAPPEVR